LEADTRLPLPERGGGRPVMSILRGLDPDALHAHQYSNKRNQKADTGNEAIEIS
jgi:hypothetical protein